MKENFRRVAARISYVSGTANAFLFALAIVAIWAVTGPLFDYSNTWQLFINTGTTIVTFLMVFLIQNAQNRDGKAMQLKLDELIRATRARDAFVDLEDLQDDELAALDDEFHKLHEKQATSDMMKKLHASIATEHKRRQNLQSHTSQVFSKLMNPLNSSKDKDSSAT